MSRCPWSATVHRLVVEGRQRAHHAHQHRHRVRVAAEALEEPGHLLVHHGVALDRGVEVGLLLGVRQLAAQQQEADIEEIAVHRELLDRIAAIQQHALVAVDVGDARLAARRREESGVEREDAGLSGQGADVDDVRSDRPGEDRQLDPFPVMLTWIVAVLAWAILFSPWSRDEYSSQYRAAVSMHREADPKRQEPCTRFGRRVRP